MEGGYGACGGVEEVYVVDLDCWGEWVGRGCAEDDVPGCRGGWFPPCY